MPKDRVAVVTGASRGIGRSIALALAAKGAMIVAVDMDQEATDAVVAEINRQRAATRVFTEQTAALNQKLTELGLAVGQTEEIAKQNLSLKKEVADLREHLDALDTRLNPPKSTPSPQPSAEDKW